MPGYFWPELWTKLGRSAKLKEKQKWSMEKPKLDNAGRSRGINFIDLEDKEFKETMKNARKKLETSVAQIIMRTILQEKVKIQYSTTIWFTSLFPCLKL